MSVCSWDAGWRSLLLRAYVDPPTVDEFTTAPTADHLIVLTTNGSCDIEGRYGGRWSRAQYRRGSLGMTAPGEAVSLRWSGETSHGTLQLHLPSATIDAAARALRNDDARLPELPNQLITEDPVVEQIMLGRWRRARLTFTPRRRQTCWPCISWCVTASTGRRGCRRVTPYGFAVSMPSCVIASVLRYRWRSWPRRRA
jgi:hypothetical protein